MNVPHIPQDVILEATGAQQALEAAKSFPVPTTPDEYRSAAEQLKAIKGRASRLEMMRKKLIEPVLATQRGINAFFKDPLEFLADAEKAIKMSMLTYDRQQGELRRKAEQEAAEATRREQERLRAEAAKAENAAREKRGREEAVARQKREQEEAKARELEAAGRAEEADRRRAAAEEAEQRRMEAAAETERRRMADAEAKRLAAETMPTAPVISLEPQKVAGISTRETWTAELTDMNALIAAAHAGDTVARSLLTFNQSTANKLAVALKGGMSVPGVKAVSQKSMAAARA